MSNTRGRIARLIRMIARMLLGAFLMLAGVSHLGTSRIEFRAQVPSWFPIDADLVVLVSGVIEILLGLALVLATGGWHGWVGIVVAAFFIIIFPGNIAQWLEGRDAFGLTSDTGRFVRLFFQPVLIVWALWCTQGWAQLRGIWTKGKRTK